jgi:hypothetical protein
LLSQDVALHLHARQLGPQPADLHVPGAHDLVVSAFELALSISLDPVEQCLIHHAQRRGCRRDALAASTPSTVYVSPLAFAWWFSRYIRLDASQRLAAVR